MTNRIISVLLCVLVLFATAACGDNKDVSSNTASTPSSSGDSAAVQVKGTYFDTDMWIPVPMISQELIDAGYENSEGCQACPYVVLDSIDGQLGFYAIDVGGMYRTTDGGKSWTPCTVGISAAGATGMAIDPNNKNRVVVVGCNSGYDKRNGLYMSVDGGEQWAEVFMPGDSEFEGQIGIHNDFRTQVAFDESSKSDKIGGSSIIYWNRERNTNANANGAYNHPAIYQSTDGGKSWKELKNTQDIAGGEIVVNSKNGNVAVCNQKGLWVSADKGKTFKQTSTLAINSIINIRTKPNNIYALTNDGLYISTDFGTNFAKVEGNFPTDVDVADYIRVAPSNPDYMICFVRGTKHVYDNHTYYTQDGGKTWAEATRSKEGSWVPVNAWHAICWYSPTDENYIISNGFRSEDGGKSFFVSRKGYNGICIGGKFAININDNSLFALGSQDYNGGYSTDNGKTWTYVNWSGEAWGGFTYGAYIMDKNHMVTTVAEGWTEPRYIATTQDGGKTVNRTRIQVKGLEAGYSAVGNDNIVFMGEWRSTDKGLTWTEMSGCKGVLAHNSKTGRLFGADGNYVVYSDDDGASWTRLCITEGTISDLDYNPKTDRVYIANKQKISTVKADGSEKRSEHVSLSAITAQSLCLDPENPNIIYATSGGYVYRSLDNGASWTNLSRQVGDGRNDCLDGGRQAGFIEFNQTTREVFVSCGCRGFWKIAACDASKGK